MWSKKKRKNFRQGGFTLIELLVAASILGVIGLVILTTFGSGFHVFERVQAFGGAQADVLLALEEMEKDINNMFPFAAMPFEGSSASITFPLIVEEAGDDDEDFTETVGRVSYFLEDATYLNEVGKSLMRGQQNYAQASNGLAFDGSNSQALAPVESLAFEFFAYDEEADAYTWQASWSEDEEQILSGIKIAATYKDGEQSIVLERAVFMPAIQKIFEIEEDEEEEEDGEDEDDAEDA